LHQTGSSLVLHEIRGAKNNLKTHKKSNNPAQPTADYPTNRAKASNKNKVSFIPRKHQHPQRNLSKVKQFSYPQQAEAFHPNTRPIAKDLP